MISTIYYGYAANMILTYLFFVQLSGHRQNAKQKKEYIRITFHYIIDVLGKLDLDYMRLIVEFLKRNEVAV